MTESTAVIIQREEPAHIIQTVNAVAGACKAIVGASLMQIQGRAYIKVEGWQAIAAAHGCTASADSVAMVEGGIAATATIRRLTDGAVLGQAEGFVGDDESMWAKRPMYARRAMAQTRAISRACRSAFAHVVVAMNAGHGTNYSTTPAEEVPADGFDDRPARGKQFAPAPAPASTKTTSVQIWEADQRAEAKSLADAITAHGESAAAELAKLRKTVAGAAPAEVIDALGKLLAQWDDVAAAAGSAQ